MAPVHQIVIIGASFGGIPLAHGLLKDVLPGLSANGEQAYKVTLISPSLYFWWKIGAPRVIVNPKSLPTEKALLPIADGFKSYNSEQYSFVQGTVTSIQPATKTLQLKTPLPDSSNLSLSYDTLIIASGTSFASPVWSVTTGSDDLTTALKDLQDRIPTAESILVAGGGAAGVETAGELGELYGGKKEITIISGSSALLSRLHNQKVGADAESRLKKMGVTVINNGIKVDKATKEGGKEVLQLSDGTTKTVDVYINATGDRPNTAFVPQGWLNERGFVKTDPQTLRLDVPELTGVYCIGSVASYSNGSVMDTKFALKPLLESIKLDLKGGSRSIPSNMEGSSLMSIQNQGRDPRTCTTRFKATCSWSPLARLKVLASSWAGRSPASWLS
jgi:apoptosis-inducing factor 2